MWVVPFVDAIDDSHRRITVATTVDLTLEDIAAILDLRSGNRHRYALLIDTSEGPLPTLTPEKIRHIVDRVTEVVHRAGPRGPTAIVAPDNAVFGMGRMFETLCDLAGIPNVRVFRNRIEAEQWLEQEPSVTT